MAAAMFLVGAGFVLHATREPAARNTGVPVATAIAEAARSHRVVLVGS